MIIHLPTPDRSGAKRSPSHRRFLLPGLLVAGFGLASLTIILWPRAAEPAAREAPAAMAVTFGLTGSDQWPDSLKASGTIAPWQEIVIGAQIGGLQLRDVRVNVGDRVRRGQVLATFDPALPRAEYARLTAALAQAEALARQAEANHLRAQSLADSGAVSAQEILRLLTEAETARAGVQAAHAADEAQRLQLLYVEVRAPDDGVVIARAATPGSLGGTGQELFRMIRGGRLEWRGELTAAQLARTAPGQTVELALPGGGTARGRLRQAAPSLNDQTRLGLVYADLTEPGVARAGMYAEGRLLLPQTPATTAPAKAVVLRDGRHYVFTVAPSSSGDRPTVTAREVRIGRRQGTDVELLSGVESGLRIVIDGAGFLKDGDSVREVAASSGAPE